MHNTQASVKKKMISTEIAAHNGILALDLLWNVDEK